MAVEEVQKITGFDRVMVYRFEPDGAGSVIAEVKLGDAPTYLGLRYPDTDIPKQAKHLYLLNPLRLIPDVSYTPVPLVPSSSEGNRPLDLSAIAGTTKEALDSIIENNLKLLAMSNTLLEVYRTGSGLDLHLAQRIARLHGGRIIARSTLGKGSTFTVELPCMSG